MSSQAGIHRLILCSNVRRQPPGAAGSTRCYAEPPHSWPESRSAALGSAATAPRLRRSLRRVPHFRPYQLAAGTYTAAMSNWILPDGPELCPAGVCYHDFRHHLRLPEVVRLFHVLHQFDGAVARIRSHNDMQHQVVVLGVLRLHRHYVQIGGHNLFHLREDSRPGKRLARKQVVQKLRLIGDFPVRRLIQDRARLRLFQLKLINLLLHLGQLAVDAARMLPADRGCSPPAAPPARPAPQSTKVSRRLDSRATSYGWLARLIVQDASGNQGPRNSRQHRRVHVPARQLRRLNWKPALPREYRSR